MKARKKIPERLVEEIRKRLLTGEKYSSIASDINVSTAVISLIKNGKRHKK